MTEYTLAVVLGVLFAVGTFLVLRRDVVRVIWGVVIVSQAANVYLVTMGGLGGSVPILAGHGEAGHVTDPLVQALVLTAIVIGFGTTAFVLVLTYRVYEEHGTIDLRELAPTPEEGRPSSGYRSVGDDVSVGTDGGHRPVQDGETGGPAGDRRSVQDGETGGLEGSTPDYSGVGDTGG